MVRVLRIPLHAKLKCSKRPTWALIAKKSDRPNQWATATSVPYRSRLNMLHVGGFFDAVFDLAVDDGHDRAAGDLLAVEGAIAGFGSEKAGVDGPFQIGVDQGYVRTRAGGQRTFVER